MASPRPAKRQRTEIVDLTSHQQPSIALKTQIALLPPAKIAELLLQAATILPVVSTMITTTVQTQEAASRSKIHDFSFASKSVWRTLTNAARGSGSRQYKTSFDAVSDINSVIRSIVAKVTPVRNSNKASRFNAMEALRMIGKTIALGQGDTLYHEVHKSFQEEGNELTSAFEKVIACLDWKERWEIRNEWVNYKGEKWGEKWLELLELAEPLCLFGGLEGVKDLLQDWDGKPEEEEDQEGGGDEGQGKQESEDEDEDEE